MIAANTLQLPRRVRWVLLCLKVLIVMGCDNMIGMATPHIFPVLTEKLITHKWSVMEVTNFHL